MKKLILIIVAITAMIMPGMVSGQSQITRPTKKKTEQTTGKKPSKQSPTNRNNATMSKDERDAILQNLINNMVFVEGGSFMMGSDDSEAYDTEKPVHRVTVGSFSIGKYEVTQKEWKSVMGNNPSDIKGNNLPVSRVSWYKCQEFINKLNSLTGRKFRLPTEEEWEFAARGGNLSNGYKFSGSNDINEIAWYGNNSGSVIQFVGTKNGNELGLYDMSGNVEEWTSSQWSNPYGKLQNSTSNVVRGGCRGHVPRDCRVSVRSEQRKIDGFPGTGFRLAY